VHPKLVKANIALFQGSRAETLRLLDEYAEESGHPRDNDPNAPLVQIEWMIAKKLTRPNISLEAWNKNWHDHLIEINSGRVKVHDLPPEEAAKVAELAKTTDGTIYHFYAEKASPMMPTGKMTVAQAVGHVPMSKADYEASAKQ